MATPLIHRFSFLERIVHWVVGVTFVVLLGTGLAFCVPVAVLADDASRRGAAARVLHPQIGALFGVGMLFMFGLWVRDMFLDGKDRAWLGADQALRNARPRQGAAGGQIQRGTETVLLGAEPARRRVRGVRWAAVVP